MKRLLIGSILLISACSTPVAIHFGGAARSAPVVGISNPSLSDGDPLRGRRAFINAECIDCHRVAEDPSLPRGRRAVAGPMLSEMSRYSPPEIARKITTRTTGMNEELFEQTMKDYSRRLRAQQLVDIVAYLRQPRGAEGRQVSSW